MLIYTKGIIYQQRHFPRPRETELEIADIKEYKYKSICKILILFAALTLFCTIHLMKLKICQGFV